MALTKLPQNAFGTGSVDSDKIEDGTIQATDISGSIANDRLANSSITFSGSSTALGGSATLAGYLDWQSVITADGSTTTTAVAGEGYIIDTTSASHTINLPASASIGDTIGIKDYAGTFGTNALVIGRNGHNIQGVANNSQLGTNRASVVLVYVDATKGWLYTNEHNNTSLGPTFISASGGTETTDGDYKVHTFTGDGCFVVSSVGNPIGATTVDYLVIAGGGSGGVGAGPSGSAGGGGGAGGLRYSASTYCNPSPTGGGAGSAVPVSATTYPITVGGGGAAIGSVGGAPRGNAGSNSVFSTITSAGGGGGGARLADPGEPGGSGGGGSNNGSGSGNTPPVSPPQGSPGAPNTGGGTGGGGHGEPGKGKGECTPNQNGRGGNGSAVSISGSPTTYAGGGGGGYDACGQTSNSVPAPGGGGVGGANITSPGTAGSTNSGSGGGGGPAGFPSGSGGSGAGGKGIVVIRYKYQ